MDVDGFVAAKHLFYGFLLEATESPSEYVVIIFCWLGKDFPMVKGEVAYHKVICLTEGQIVLLIVRRVKRTDVVMSCSNRYIAISVVI